MRRWEMAEEVVAALGQADRMRGTESRPVQCWECAGWLDSEEPAAVVVLHARDAAVDFAQPAHVACSCSQVRELTAQEVLRALGDEAGDTSTVDMVAATWPTFPSLVVSYRHEVLHRNTPERSDALVTGLLRQGWHLITTVEAPPAPGPDGHRLRVTRQAADGVGQMELVDASGAAVTTVANVLAPDAWWQAIATGGPVAILHSSRVLTRAGVGADIDLAIRDGVLVGGTVPVSLVN